MKNRNLYFVLAALIVGGIVYLGSKDSLTWGQGSILPTSSHTVICTRSTVFDADANDTDDFITLMDKLSGNVSCPYSIHANAYPVDGDTPMLAKFECDSSNLEIQADSSTDSYQIECNQEGDESQWSMRANLTPQEDGSYTLGVNMDEQNDHRYMAYPLDPDTLSIERMAKADY